MALPYWLLSDLENRLSAEVVRQVFDDNGDGVADAAVIVRLQSDSDSWVEGYLRGNYDLAAVRANPPNQVRRLSLDYAEACTARRHGEYVRRDWKGMLEQAEKELRRIRSGEVRLDVEGTPEPATNHGGAVWDGSTDYTADAPKVFIGGMGDF